MDEPVRHNYRIPLHMLVLAAFGGAGGWFAVAIDSPAIADGIDIIVFVILSLLAGWAFLALLPRLRQLPGAYRDARAGILLPVLMKEMRQMMRGKWIPWLMLASAGTAVAFCFGFLTDLNRNFDNLADLQACSSGIGCDLVHEVIGVLSVVVVIALAPVLTAGAFSAEREKSTLEMLLLTRMSPAQIVFGKLLSGLSVLGLILLCSLPVAGVGFMLGGVSGWLLLASLTLLIASSFCFGAIGLWCSTIFRRTATAMVMAYVLCALLILFTPLMTDLVIPLWDLLDDGSGGLSFWLQTLAVILATLLLIAFAFSWFRQRLSRRTHRAWLTVGVLVFFLGCANLSINSFSTSDTRRTSWLSSLASDDWSEYIEYIDPILATGIVMGPSGDFEYAGIYADFDNDWPIILTNIAVFLLIAKLMLALTSQALCRLRLGNRAKPAPSVTSEPGG